jgi:hypothetical protein
MDLPLVFQTTSPSSPLASAARHCLRTRAGTPRAPSDTKAASPPGPCTHPEECLCFRRCRLPRASAEGEGTSVRVVNMVVASRRALTNSPVSPSLLTGTKIQFAPSITKSGNAGAVGSPVTARPLHSINWSSFAYCAATQVASCTRAFLPSAAACLVSKLMAMGSSRMGS